MLSAHFGSTYTVLKLERQKISMAPVQDNMQIHEAFHILKKKKKNWKWDTLLDHIPRQYYFREKITDVKPPTKVACV